MDGAVLPLMFYSRNAQLCLQKAAESQKSFLGVEELQHLKAFTTLVSTTIPSHPNFRDQKEDKQLLELHANLSRVAKRIRELEDCGDPTSNHRPHPTTNGKHSARQLKMVEVSLAGRLSAPQKLDPSSKLSAESMMKPQKCVRIAAAPKPPRLAERTQRCDMNGTPNIRETYGIVAKSGTPPRGPLSLIQRLKKASDALAADSKPPLHNPQNGKEVVARSQGSLNPASAAGEIMPYRPKRRDVSRIRGGAGTMSGVSSRSAVAKALSYPSKMKTLEMAPYETGSCQEKSSSLNKALVSHRAHDESENGVTIYDNCSSAPSSAPGTELVMRGRSEATEGIKEVVVVKGSSGKQKLANHATGAWGRGILDGAPPDQAGSRGVSSLSNGVVVETNQDKEEENWSEMGKGNLRELQSAGAGYGEESTALDGRQYQGGAHEEQRHGVRGEGLREWKGGFVREGERLHELHDQGENGGSSPARLLHHRRLDVARKTDNRPASAPRRMQGISMDQKPKQAGEKLDLVDVSERDSKILAGTVKPGKVVKGARPPGVQRGVKEDCERFRRQMRLLKEKADDSRIREVEVEGMADRLQRRLVDEMDLAASDIRLKYGFWAACGNGEKDIPEFRDVNRLGMPSTLLHGGDPIQLGKAAASHSPRKTMTRLKGASPLPHPKPHPANSEPATPLATDVRPSHNSSMTASASTSGSSLSSLPLSHYIEKLKNLTPELQLGSANLDLLTKAGNSSLNNQHESTGGHDHVVNHKIAPVAETHMDTITLRMPSTPMSYTADERRDLSLSVSSPGPSSAILLPATISSSSSAHGLLHRSPAPARYSNRSGLTLYPSSAHPPQLLSMPRLDSTSVNPDEQHVNAILGSSTMVSGGHLQDGGKYPSASTLEQLYFPPDESRPRVLSRSIYETAHHEANDEKLANIQRVLGELKGSVEGMKIRIEVEGEGWRGRVEGLEKDVENLKEDADDEIIAAKHSLRSELKMKLGDFMADAEKMRREEREQMEMMVGEKIGKQLQAQSRDSGSCLEMKNEIRLLWAEVEALSKSREEMQGQVHHLTSVAQNAQEHASREQDILKSENGYLRKQLQSLKNDGVQVRLDSEDFGMQREDLRTAVEGTDIKLEIQGLQNVDKVMKVEIEALRTGLGKLQEETEELKREKVTSQTDGDHERLLIMERVESLSQLYLGGLEEVRSEIFNLKLSCRNRMDELESQWSELKRQQENSSEESSASISRQMLLDELDHFRSEMAEMVEIERGHLGETLEREIASMRRQVMDVCVNNKSEMLSTLRLEVQKRLQSAHEKVLLMTDALKREMDTLKTELGQVQEGGEDLTRAVTVAERQKDMAAAAAVDASMSATKASDILTEMLGTFSCEIANARRKTVQLQENLAMEKDMVAAAAFETRRISQELLKEKESALLAVQEARQKNQELQDYLERESSKLVTAMVGVQKERDTASQAASESTSSAVKAGEVLAEVLGSFNLEMAKVRRMSMQLQEGLEKEREGLQRERELAIQHNQEAQNRFSEELELAIASWKRAMDAEVAKAKELTEGLEDKSKRRAPFTLDQENLQLSTGFTAHHELEGYISKTEDALRNLTRTVKQLQDSRDNYQEEKKQRLTKMQEGNERRDRDWKSEISQINQVVRGVEKRVNEASAEHTEVRKKLKRIECTQTDLVHSVKEVRSNTCELEKAVTMWLPRYEAAARVVNDISCKVERMEEKFEGFGCDERFVQQISRVAETKVQGLKELVLSDSTIKDIGLELRDLHERVEGDDRAHCQAIADVESRVAELENMLSHSAGQPGPGLSLKLEYTEKSNGAECRKQGMGLLGQSVEALERKLEMMTDHSSAPVGGTDSAIDSRLLGLESRIEYVASATFTNLRLLDGKVERVSAGVQSAVEGAALAESKCGALGAELVKVFRMLTACKNPSSASARTRQPSTNSSGARRGRSHSPPTQSLNPPRLDSRSQSPPSRFSGASNFSQSRSNHRGLFSPMRRSRVYISPNRLRTSAGGKRSGLRGACGGEAQFAKGTQSSELRKVTARERGRGESANSGASEEGSSPFKEGWDHSQMPFREVVKDCKLHGQALTVVDERKQPGEHPTLHQHLPIEKRQDASGKNRQKTNIRLEAGRIHVNVSHRSAIVNQSEKRGDLIAVQS